MLRFKILKEGQKLKNILIYILFTAFIFPIKIFSLELRYVAYIAIIVYYIINSRYRIIDIKIITISYIFLIYTLVLSLIYININNFILLRTFRFFLSNLAILLLFSSCCIDSDDIIKILKNIIIIHIAAVFLEFFYPISKEYIINIFQIKISLLPLRSFGIIDGYDTAGLLINIYLAIILFKIKKNIAINILISLVSSILTGRSSFFINLIIFIIYLIYKKKHLNQIILYLLFILVIIININIIDNIINNITNSPLFRQSYQKGTIDALTEYMIVFPDTLSKNLLGTGELPYENGTPSDIGYINLIYMYGIFGLSIIIYYYITIYKAVIKAEDIEKKIVLIIIILNFIMNYKITILTASGFTEILLFISYSIISNTKKKE